MLWETLFIIAAVLLVGAVMACVWLVAQRRHLATERDGLRGQLAESQTQEVSLRNALTGRNEELVKARAQLDGLDDKFKALATDVLRNSNEQFLQLAKKSLESGHKDAAAQLEHRKQAIDAMIKPVREALEKYNTSMQQVESSRVQAYGQLREQLSAMLTDQRALRDETSNLVQALRRPEVRGRWGEMQLRRVAELAGMIDNCDFTEQDSVETESGRLRPDMVVYLPADRCIVVDAKTPLDAFISAIESSDADERRTHMDRHVRHIETKVRDLSNKQYQAQFKRSIDFVVLFIPGEGFLQAAVQVKPQLMEAAMQRGVVIATPSTLIALLKAVAMGWREQRLTEHAQHISQLGRELHERLRLAGEHLQSVGGSLESAVKSYNRFLGSFESRVLVTARKFEDLGAGSGKAIAPDVKPVEVLLRDMKNLPAGSK